MILLKQRADGLQFKQISEKSLEKYWTGASQILARRHYISISLFDFYRQVKLNLCHQKLL